MDFKERQTTNYLRVYTVQNYVGDIIARPQTS